MLRGRGHACASALLLAGTSTELEKESMTWPRSPCKVAVHIEIRAPVTV
jgi:hypothetical protein